MKIAIVHDWLVSYAGSEKVLEALLTIYPEADLFSTVDFLAKDQRDFIMDKPVQTTFIQKLPFSKKKYRQYLPLMPLAIEQLDVSKYDVVLSSSHAVAKGVITGPDQLHISYIHSPIRYAWDLQHQYLKESNLQKGIKGMVAKSVLHYMRMWDYRTSNSVDQFLANSAFIGNRVKKVYQRSAKVIYPPVDVSAFTLRKEKEDFYLTASRMVPYKKMDLIVNAFAGMPDKQLYVIGDGPDMDKIKQKATANITLLGYQSFEVLLDYMQRARAFVFAAEEDFGITPVEAQACGTPVIAYGKGGALETVRGMHQENPTGLFFKVQEEQAIQAAVAHFEQECSQFDAENIRQHALQFSPDIFKHQIKEYVGEAYKTFG